MPWLLNEDAALKAKLQGLTVQDVNAPDTGRPVVVRFRFPETEIGDVKFPMIVIEHGNISEAEDRRHQGGFFHLPYSPEGYDPLPDPTNPKTSPYGVDEWPLPYNLDYFITTYARTALHDRMLTAALAARERIPARFGFLEVPQDGTVRRLDLIGGPSPNDSRDNEGKRLFSKTYSVRVSSELLPSTIYTLNHKVQSVDIDLNYYSDTYDIA